MRFVAAIISTVEIDRFTTAALQFAYGNLAVAWRL